MNKFERLFGIKNTSIKKCCVLLPLVPRGSLEEFKIAKLSRGKLYACGNNEDFSVIHTGMSAGLTGDAVLYLKDSPCRGIFLFGSCGSTGNKSGLNIGSLVSPSKCYSRESFSETLLGRDKEPRVFFADQGLSGGLIKAIQAKEVTCMSLSSLKLEEEMAGEFKSRGIDVVDMECSAFFSAAEFSGIKSAALFYVNDIVSKNPFYRDLNPVLEIKLSASIRNACRKLRDFIREDNDILPGQRVK